MAVTPEMQKFHATAEVVAAGIWNCTNIILVGSNVVGVVTQEPWAVSEKSTVCIPGALSAKNGALSLFSCVVNATRIEVVGIVVPLSTKQNPVTP